MTRGHQPAATSPWTADDVTRWAPRVAVGILLVVWAWFQADGEDRIQDQVAWANASVLGLVVVFHANLTFLLRARRAIGERRRRLLGESGAKAAATPDTSPTEAAALVAPVDGTRYHRADCALAADRRTVTSSRATHERARRHPCGVCQP